MMSRVNNAISLATLGHFAIEVCYGYLPVVYPLFREQFGLTYVQIGLIALVATSTTSLAQPIFGYLADRWDARRVTALSILWLGTIMGLIGLARSYPVLLLAVALAGFGSAAFHPAGAAVVSRATQGRRGLALSFFAVGGNLGVALSPLLIAGGLAWLGLPGTVILFPLALVTSGWVFWGFGRGRPADAATQPCAPEQNGRGFALGLALIVLAAMTRSWFHFTLMTYLPTWLEGRGYTVVYGGQMLFLFSLCVGVGSLAGGVLSDRVGRWQVLLASLGLLGPAFWLYLHTGGPVQAILTGSLGFFIGCTFPVAVVLAQEVWPRGVALASGLVMGLGWWPGGLGASFTGWLADRTSLDTALQTLIVAPLMGAFFLGIFVLALRSQQQRQSPELMHSSLP